MFNQGVRGKSFFVVMLVLFAGFGVVSMATVNGDPSGDTTDVDLQMIEKQRQWNIMQRNRNIEEKIGEVRARNMAVAVQRSVEQRQREREEQKERERMEMEAAAAAEAERQVREEQERLAAQQAEVPLPPPPPATTTFEGGVWDALAQCESSGNWAMNSGNGFYGGLQFMLQTWLNMGGDQYAYYPHDATRDQQIEVATRLQAQYGWGQWPACSSRLGLR